MSISHWERSCFPFLFNDYFYIFLLIFNRQIYIISLLDVHVSWNIIYPLLHMVGWLDYGTIGLPGRQYGSYTKQ